MKWRSIEFRLTAWYSLILFLGYVVFGALLWVTVRYSVVASVDELLKDRAQRLVDVVAADADGPEEVEEELVELVMTLPESHLARIRGAGNREVYPVVESEPTIPWDGAGGQRSFRTVTTAEAVHRALTEEVSILGRPYTVLLASSLQSLVVVRDRLAVSFLIATPLALLVCSAGGFFIARRALKPVDQIAETASNITVTNLGRRIAVPDTRDSLERLARTFNEMLERLERSVDRIEQFSADASHELRTPLSVIRTTAELALRHGRTEEEYRADLRDIHAQAEHLSDLVEVLLTLSRRGVENPSVPMSEVNLVETASDVCRQFEAAAESKGLKLQIDSLDRGVTILGNEPSLRRMIASLLENALAHTEAGRIGVSVGQVGEEIHLSVTDTGEGIPEEALGRIFDRFYRVESSRTPTTGRPGRVGLGLSIAQRIAALHAAELTVRSRAGEGSCFTVRFRR